MVKIIELDPDNLFVYSAIAQVFYVLKDYENAIKNIKIAIEQQPFQANLFFNLGMMYRENNQKQEAIKAFEKGLELEPYDGRARAVLNELKNS